MALAAICGIKESSFSYNEEADDFSNEFCMATNLANPLQLSMPPLANPWSARADFTRDEGGKEIKIHFAHGTTTLGMVFKNGVVLAVDSRATSGQYIASGTVRKVIPITEYLLGTLAGGAADCAYWDRVLAKQCRMYELRNKERISTAAASKLMTNISYSYKGMGLSMGMMLCGWDKRGPSLYYVDSDANRTQGNLFSVGSGSIYAYGVLDAGHKWDLTDEEAYDLARRAIYSATYRDSYSGGIVRVYHMKQAGWEIISEDDCMDLHYKYTAPAP